MTGRFNSITDILFGVGTFSRPFLNYVLEKELAVPTNDVERVWKYFFTSLKLEQDRRHEVALVEVEKGLKKCKSVSMRYLLLTRKLIILMKEKRYKEADRIYVKLRNSIPRIPPKARYGTIITSILGYCSLSETYTKCAGKLRVDQMDDGTRAFIYLGLGREAIKNGDLSAGISNLKKSYRFATSSFHPAGMILALNAVSWYMRDRHPSFSERTGRSANYLAGYYFDINKFFYTVDTIFTVLLTRNSEKLLDYARLIDNFAVDLPEFQRKSSELVLNEARRLNALSTCADSIHTVDASLIEILRKKAETISGFSSSTGIDRKTISAILSGKNSKIRSETVRKVLDTYDIPFDRSLSEPLLIEKSKQREKTSARAFLKRLLESNPSDRSELLFALFSSLVNRKQECPSLVRKNSMKSLCGAIEKGEKSEEEILAKSDWRRFLSLGVLQTDYERARFDLALKFLNELSPQVKTRLISKYFESSERMRLLVDSFMRNYVRYERDWGVRIEVAEYKELLHSLRLHQKSSAIAFYCFEGRNDRERLISFLEALRD